MDYLLCSLDFVLLLLLLPHTHKIIIHEFLVLCILWIVVISVRIMVTTTTTGTASWASSSVSLASLASIEVRHVGCLGCCVPEDFLRKVPCNNAKTGIDKTNCINIQQCSYLQDLFIQDRLQIAAISALIGALVSEAIISRIKCDVCAYVQKY